MSAYDDVLARRVAATGPVSLSGGSGYFAPRGKGLDPALFDEHQDLRLDVRRHLLGALHGFLSKSMVRPQMWATLWVAGSGATTAWSADRESGGAPGDLDTLIGINYDNLRSMNPRYSGSSDAAIGHELNQRLHDGLWPSTSHDVINGSVYETTFYINAGIGAGDDDILAINPYAAYNVTEGFWSQPPVEVPQDFSDAYFSAADHAKVADDASRAADITSRFNTLREAANGMLRASPYHVNTLSLLHRVVSEGAALFDDIHDHRHDAFSPGGKGYFDPANYRWQASKANGSITAARALKQLDESVHRDMGTGGDHANPQHLLLLGSLANGGGQ